MTLEAMGLKALVFALLTAACTLAAHQTAAVYHDGLRTSLPGLWTGVASRPELAGYAYSISVGFVLAYALPFSFATGIIAIWLVLLPAEVIGLRARSLALALTLALGWGAAASLGVDLFSRVLQAWPGVGDALLTPLAFALPLFGPMATAKLYGWRWALAVGVVELVIWRAVDAMAFHADPIKGWTLGGAAVALVIPAAVLVALAMRPAASSGAIGVGEGIIRIRRNWPYLIAPPALLALVASQGWLAGDPFQIALLHLHAAGPAALAAGWVAIGFFPLIAMTGLVSGVWTQDGYADWYLAGGYLAGNPGVAAAVGVGLAGVELGTLPAARAILETRPAIHTLANAARETLDEIAIYASLAGAVLAGYLVAGGAGVFVTLGAYGLNQVAGGRVMAAAAPIIGFLVVVVGATLVRATLGSPA